MKRRYLAAAVLAAMSLPSVALAEDAAASGNDEASKWTGDVGLSILVKRGNSDSNSLNGNANASRDGEKWRHTGKFDAVNEEEFVVDETDPSSGEYVRTDESYFVSYKLDRKLEQSRNYLYNLLQYKKDAFSGFQYTFTYSLGVGRRWIETDKHKLETEIGPGYRAECLEPEDSYTDCSDNHEEAIGHLALKYVWQISEGARFSEEITSDFGESTNSTRMETVLTSKLNKSFSLRIRHLLEHETDVPVGVRKEADHEFSVGLVYTF